MRERRRDRSERKAIGQCECRREEQGAVGLVLRDVEAGIVVNDP